MAVSADDALNGGDKTNAALNGAYGNIASVKGAYKQAQDVLGKEDKAMQPALDREKATASQPIPAPPEPQKASPAPDLKQFQADSQGWITAISALSAFVGARGRMGGTGALKAFAAGVKGIQEGNKSAFDAATTKWKADTEAMLKNNDEEMKKYDAILKNREISESEAMNEIKMVAAEHQNSTMLAMDNYHQAAAAYDSRQKLTLQADLAYKKMDAHEKLLQEREDKKDAQIAKNLKNFDSMKDTDIIPGLGATKADVLNKVKTLHETGGSYAAAGISTRTMNNPIKDMVESVKAQMYPDENMSTQRSKFVGDQAESRAIGTAAGKISLAANSLDQSLPLLEDAIKKVDLTRFPDLNALNNYAAQHTGDPNITRLNTALQTTVTDYSTLIARNGQRTDATDAAAKHLANVNMANGQLQSFIDQVRREKTAQLKATQLTKEGKQGDSGTAPAAAKKTKTIGDTEYYQDENGDWNHD